MKLFYIELNEWDYDEYDSCVLAAESVEQVNSFVERNFYDYENKKWLCDGVTFQLSGDQKVEKIEEIGTTDKYTVPTIICSSFNAG